MKKNIIDSLSIEELRHRLAAAHKYKEFFQGLNITSSCGFYLKCLRKRIAEENIDISHFTRGTKHGFSSGIKSRRCLDKMLYLLNRPVRCEWCGIEDMWNNKPIRIQLDHIDGNKQNNLSENLRYLCPNCHSQTDTFCSKNKKNINAGQVFSTESPPNHKTLEFNRAKILHNTNLYLSSAISTEDFLKEIEQCKFNAVPGYFQKQNVLVCELCSKRLSRKNKSGKCSTCVQKGPPTKLSSKEEELKYLVWNMTTLEIGQRFNVSTQLVSRFCKRNNILVPNKNYWTDVKSKKRVLLSSVEIDTLYKDSSLIKTINVTRFNSVCSCGSVKEYVSSFCNDCKITNLKENGKRRFSFETIKYDVWKQPIVHLAKKIGVSDSAVLKYCRINGVVSPPRGYWARVKAGKTMLLSTQEIDELYK